MEYNDLEGLLKTLPTNGVVWKYTSFEHAIDLFRSSSLYFRRLDKYPIKDYEGHFGSYEYGWLLKFLQENKMEGDVSPEVSVKSLIEELKIKKTRFFISCWMNNNNPNFESRRHWEAFGDSNSENCGLLLRTTVEEFMKALIKSDLDGSFSQAEVNYSNWDRLNLSVVFNSKPNEFRWEAEARFSITMYKKEYTDYLRVPVSLPAFIKEVRYPPSLSMAKKNELLEVLHEVGLDEKVTPKRSLMKWD